MKGQSITAMIGGLILTIASILLVAGAAIEIGEGMRYDMYGDGLTVFILLLAILLTYFLEPLMLTISFARAIGDPRRSSCGIAAGWLRLMRVLMFAGIFVILILDPRSHIVRTIFGRMDVDDFISIGLVFLAPFVLTLVSAICTIIFFSHLKKGRGGAGKAASIIYMIEWTIFLILGICLSFHRTNPILIVSVPMLFCNLLMAPFFFSKPKPKKVEVRNDENPFTRPMPQTPYNPAPPQPRTTYQQPAVPRKQGPFYDDGDDAQWVK